MRTDFKSIEQPFSNKIVIDGEDYLYFGGTAYLGIPQNEAFANLYIEGIKKFGISNGTSRNNNIQLGIYNVAEIFASKRFGSHNALITSSGYLAAQLTVKALSFFGEVLYAPNSHPAVWINQQENQLLSFTDWATDTVNYINASDKNKWVIISNSMNNLFPEIYDFSFLQHIHSSNEIILIVDDSHGIGINYDGRGAYQQLPQLKNVDPVVVASMAKALGIDAGLVLSSAKIIGLLKKTNEFLGASPPSAAALFAFMHADDIYTTQLKHLQRNIDLFISKNHLITTYTPGFPVFLIDNEAIADELLNAKILISSFPYPNANSKVLNRIVLCSWHLSKEIEKLTETLKRLF